MFWKIQLASVAVLFFYQVNSQEPCTTKGGQAGSCINIRSCPAAVQDIQKKINPQICGFSGPDPVVCCAGASALPAASTAAPVLTTSRRPWSQTTDYGSPLYDYQSNYKGECEPLSADKTAPKTGRKAWDKCIDYQEELVFPCQNGTTLTGEKTRAYRCNHGADEPIILWGEDTSPRVFPHMVLLGFGDTPEEAKYLCGGSIISDKFVLTAAHCTWTQEFGAVAYAVLGAHKRTDQVSKNQLYKIAKIIRHPNYKQPLKYNDIALLETDRTMSLDQFAVPACLHTGDAVDMDRASATGWGAVKYKGPNANTMQKVVLSKFSTPECQTHFPVSRVMPQGFNEDTQLCYGDKREVKDTCQGDSGGPLQVKSQRIYCMYTIVGVTSFGRACGFVGEPGIYTRVAPFVSWIESVVWP